MRRTSDTKFFGNLSPSSFETKEYADSLEPYIDIESPNKEKGDNEPSTSAYGQNQTSQVSKSVQTYITSMNWFDESPICDNRELPLEDWLEQDIQDMNLEEVTLRKSNSEERIGLTVCYSSDEADACTEVYISDIIPESVADRDGRLRQGDQILQVNGKDVATKEETESLFAENKNAVTLLISRCIYQDDESLQSHENLTEDLCEPLYGNTSIETHKVTEKEQIQDVKAQSAFESDSKIVISCDSQQIMSTNFAKQIQRHDSDFFKNEILNNTNSLIRNKIETISKEIAMLDHRMQSIQIINKDKLISETSDFDIEHIYETIPESNDSELEPIYSSPYESEKVTGKEQSVAERKDGNTARNTNEKTLAKVKTCSRVTSSSEEERESRENSSSAYNTGGSSNSNPLTLKLNCRNTTNRSMLQLCPPTTEKWSETERSKTVDNFTRHQSRYKNTKEHNVNVNKLTSPMSPHSTPGAPSKHMPADTMYTNVANLQQTILLQQQLFRQELCRQGSQSQRFVATPTTSFTAPSLSQFQIVSKQHMCCKCSSKQHAETNVRMEWKVKRRQDGTRYIARRPVRNRILRNRAIKISEERAGLTTEDETNSELKIGRYWTKEERKKQVERAHEKKHRQIPDNNIDSQKQVRLPDKCQISHPTTSATAIKKPEKKSLRKKNHKEGYDADFQTVQEIIVHSARTSHPSTGKMMGLLSVTTV